MKKRKMITLKNGEKIGICGSYFKDFDGCWGRRKSLDRECSEQRMLQTWVSNKNCRGRNFDTIIDRPQEIIKNGKTWIWNLYSFDFLCNATQKRSSEGGNFKQFHHCQTNLVADKASQA